MEKRIIGILAILFIVILISGCEIFPVPPTSEGIVITIYPNPVHFDSTKGGWYYTIEIKNVENETIHLSKIEIRGIIKYLVFNLPIPDEDYNVEKIKEVFGKADIAPGETISGEEGYTENDIEGFLEDLPSYPGLDTESAIGGLNVNIRIRGFTESGDYIEATSGTILFSNK